MESSLTLPQLPSSPEKRDMIRLPLILVLASLSLSIILGSLEEATSLPCDEDGACFCNIPDPSTILDGARLFLGGRHCDEEMTMCDGTNKFWCEHGGKCQEIVQGEVYNCSCPAGYGGDRCELHGAPCGGIFCYRGAQCLVEGDTCECPVGWRGSVDCSLPTNHSSGSSADSSATLSSQSGYNSAKGMMLLVVFLVLCSVVAICGAVSSGRKSQKLSQRSTSYQMLEVEDDNNNNATELETIRDDDNLHL